jgi:hypothetical protein
VHQCVEAGLVVGSKIYVDASLVDANASLRSVKPSEAEVLSAIGQTSLEQIAKLDGDGVGRAALSKAMLTFQQRFGAHHGPSQKAPYAVERYRRSAKAAHAERRQNGNGSHAAVQ